MNDFTKEELQMLSHGILLSITEDTQERYAPLYNKIESMIENYIEPPKCLHKEIITGAYSRSNPPKKCDVCGVLYRG